MNRYTLLQAPVTINERSSQIIIVDTSNILGKKRAEKKIADGWREIGHIESELTPHRLKDGFESDLKYQRELARRASDRVERYLKTLSELTRDLIPSDEDVLGELIDEEIKNA